MSKAREFVSPSDLTFSWQGCHRCLWLHYTHGLKAPAFFPLVGELSALQEGYFKEAASTSLHPSLPPGRVVSRGAWVQSTPISIDGRQSPYAVRGKYDLLIQFEDGTYGVVDCKFQGKNDDKSAFYSPQLEAYAFALEHPASGEAKTISVTGLLVWSPRKPVGAVATGFSLELEHSWFPVQRDPMALQSRLREFIAVVSGPEPGSDDDCKLCRFVASRRDICGND